MASRKVRHEGVEPRVTIAKKVTIDAETVIERSRTHAGNFKEFIQERGVVGLAVGIILGSSITAAANSFVDDIVDPILALLIGNQARLDQVTFHISRAEIRIGQFVTALIDVLLLVIFVFVIYKLLKLDKLDKKKKS